MNLQDPNDKSTIGILGGAFLPVDEPKLHNLYHVSWSYAKGVVGRCISIDSVNKTVKLRNPKTNKDWANPVKWTDLRHTRKMQQKIESKTR